MSTRCQVIVKDKWGELWFYRHCDGYPDGVKSTLDTFCQWVKDKRIRDNVQQAAGWLIILGRSEYEQRGQNGPWEPGHDVRISGWVIGAYEPCTPVLHGDIVHLYVVNLETASWSEVASFDTEENTYKEMI